MSERSELHVIVRRPPRRGALLTGVTATSEAGRRPRQRRGHQ